MATSRRRGTFLRRRRRALQVAPVLLLLPLAFLPSASSPSSLDVVDRPPTQRTAAPDPAVHPTPPDLGEPPEPDRTDLAGRRLRPPAREVTGPYATGRERQPVPRRAPRGASRLTPAFRTDGFAVADRRGDAHAGTGVPEASVGTADIVQAKYSTDAAGLRLEIEVAEPADADVYYYKVFVTSPVDGCFLEVYVAGPTASGFYLVCGGAGSVADEAEEWTPVDGASDGRRATMTIAHGLFPQRMAPESELRFRAVTSTSHAADVPGQRIDTAESSTTLRRR